MHWWNGPQRIEYTGLESFAEKDKAAVFMIANRFAVRMNAHVSGGVHLLIHFGHVQNESMDLFTVSASAYGDGKELAFACALAPDCRKALHDALTDLAHGLPVFA